MAAVELATGYITLTVETKELGRQVGRAFSGVEGTASKAGQAMGQSMGKAFEQAKPDISALEREVARSQQKIIQHKEAGSRKIEAADRKVEIAQARVNETLTKYGEDSSQYLRANDQLVTAKQKAEAETLSYNTALGKLESQLGETKEALGDAEKATLATGDSADEASEKYAKGWRGVAQRLRDTLTGGVEKASSEAESAAKRGGERAGGFWSNAMSTAVGVGIANIGVGLAKKVGGFFSNAFSGGFSRLTAIENAQAKLRGLGNDAQSVETIMKNATEAVTGTAYGLDDAATVAAGAVAAGIKPGEALESVLKSVANSAAASGSSLDEMGAIYNKVATKDMAQMDVLNQVADRGIPIIQTLADQLGVSAGEVQKLASKGKIGFKEFEQAMTSASGTVAEEMGNTFTGSVSLVQSSLSRMGANLWAGIFDKLAPALQGLTGWLKELEPVAAIVGEKIGDFVTTVVEGIGGLWDVLIQGDFSERFREAFGIEEDHPLVGFLFNVREGFETLTGFLKGAGAILFSGEFLGSGVMGLEEDHPLVGLLFNIREGFEKLAGYIQGGASILFSGEFAGQGVMGVEEDHPLVGFLFSVREGFEKFANFLTQDAIPALKNLGGWIVVNKDWLLSLFVTVGTGIVTFKAIKLATDAWASSKKLWTAVTTKATAAQKGFNTALRANPIGLIITAVTALVAGLVWFFTQTETGKEIWGGFVNWLKDLWAGVSDWFSGIWDAISGAFDSAMEWIGDTATWLWEEVLEPVFEWIGKAWDALVTGITWAWENILEPAWDAIASAATWLWENVLEPVFEWIGEAWENWTNNAKWAWENVLKPAWDAVSDAATWLWEDILQPTFEWIAEKWEEISELIAVAWEEVIEPAWNAVSDTATWLWEDILEPAFAGISSEWDSMTSNIDSAWNNTLKPAWDAVANAAKWLWEDVLKPVFNWIGKAWDGLVTGINWVWERVLKPALDGIGRGFDRLWRTYVKPVLDSIGKHWDQLMSGMVSLWENTLKPALDTIMNLMKGDFPAAFESAKKFVDEAWKGVANVIRAPINWVIDMVYNKGLRTVFNKIANIVGLDELPATEGIPEFAKGGLHKGGWAIVGEEGPELVNFDRPGRIYTADETQEMLAGRAQAPEGALSLLTGGSPSQSMLPVGGWWDSVVDFGKSAFDNTIGRALEWARGKLADTAVLITDPLKNMIKDMFGGGSQFGQMIGDIATTAIDKAIDWIRGKDSEAYGANGEFLGSYDGPLGAFTRPVNGPITSHFGRRWGGIHSGTDFAVPVGTAVRAMFDGIVQRAAWNAVTGRTGKGMVLGHGQGQQSYYGHLSEWLKKPGDEVKSGDVIALSGNTGNSTGPHLHLEHWIAGRPVNPMGLLRDRGGVLPQGSSVVHNWTRDPEWIYTNKQQDTVKKALDIVGGAGQPLVGQLVVSEPSQVKAAFDELSRVARRKKRGGALV